MSDRSLKMPRTYQEASSVVARMWVNIFRTWAAGLDVLGFYYLTPAQAVAAGAWWQSIADRAESDVKYHDRDTRCRTRVDV